MQTSELVAIQILSVRPSVCRVRTPNAKSKKAKKT